MKTLKYLIFIGSGIFLLANSDFRQLVKNYFSLHRMRKKSIALDRRYDDMKREKKLLAANDTYLEKIARYRLHMIGPGEYEFRFTPPTKDYEN
jgi:cell division protein FtsB